MLLEFIYGLKRVDNKKTEGQQFKVEYKEYKHKTKGPWWWYMVVSFEILI